MKLRILLIIALTLIGAAHFAMAGTISLFGVEPESDPTGPGGIHFRILDFGPLAGSLLDLEADISPQVKQGSSNPNGFAAKLALDYDLALVTPEIFASYLSGTDLAFQSTDAGLWVVGLKAKNLSLFPRLTQDIALMYGQGADQRTQNDSLVDRTSLTSKDSLLGISWDTRYQLLEQLAAYMELGYIRIDRDDEPNKNKKELTADQIYRMSLGFKYDF